MKEIYIEKTIEIVRQIDDVEVLKKIYTVAKTHLDILRGKGGAS